MATVHVLSVITNNYTPKLILPAHLVTFEIQHIEHWRQGWNTNPRGDDPGDSTIANVLF